MFDYIRAVKPGPPPFGWKDITPYFGGMPQTLGVWKQRAAEYGYLLCMQTVIENGQKYRRVAVALAPFTHGKPAANERRRRNK